MNLDRIILHLWSIIQTQNFQYSKVLLAQAIHETGDFTSPLWRDLKNPWGMAMPRVRLTTAKPGRMAEGHIKAAYNSIWSAVKDRLLLDQYNGIVFNNPLQYMAEVVSRGYAVDPLYLTKWQRVYDSI